MKNKLFSVTAVFGAIIILLTCFFYFSSSAENGQTEKSKQIVALNEIDQLVKSGDTALAEEKISDLEKNIRSTEITEQKNNQALLIGGISLTFLMAVSLYIYFSVLRPFDKLQCFADSIAKGNFDIPLKYERKNYFGKFTWAFDSMRNEITKARQCEKEAVENNKTVIATLSHDIKTPIASIRAYTEGLQANMDSTPERREKYLSVIMRKCDEVAKLTNDLFLHSLSDLDKLKINSEKLELCSFVEKVVLEIAGEHNDVNFEKPEFEAFISADKNRLTQIIENLINNSRKYAKTKVDIKLTQTDDCVNIHFTDYGKGIPDSDMPFIFDKFYRGKNVEDEQGSGLGLYIIKYLVEKMNGKVLLHNHTNSFEAIVTLPK
ncbi:MAG: HAMP domain-containing sensor histidine kinase [Acutalibacteraceae bacterium]|nr:HAMP domain-containing sensor histidine kinase [Acutalibacteraceae bacterium]